MIDIDDILNGLEEEKKDEKETKASKEAVQDTAPLSEAETYPVDTDIETEHKPKRRRRSKIEVEAKEKEEGRTKKKYSKSRRRGRGRRSSRIDWFFG